MRKVFYLMLRLAIVSVVVCALLIRMIAMPLTESDTAPFQGFEH